MSFFVHMEVFLAITNGGGLPTELGALFFLAIIWMGLTDRSRRGTALAVLCYGGLVMAHHLSGLIATWVLGFYIAASYVGRVDGVLRVWVLRVVAADRARLRLLYRPLCSRALRSVGAIPTCCTFTMRT